MNGWSGKSIWVDLTNKEIKVNDIDKKVLTTFIGSRGLNDWVLYNHIKPGIDPLSPENLLCFAVGPLTGTSLSSTSRIHVSTLSPLTGILGDGNGGGSFAIALKRAGFDQIVFSGASDSPVALIIDGNQISLIEAQDLKETSTWKKTDALKDRFGKDFSVAAIGQAGENMVRFASVIFDKHNSAARGSGAVMGAKQLMAIAVRGKTKTSIADPLTFEELAKLDRDYLMNDSFQKDIVAKIGTHVGMIRWYPGYRNNEKYLAPEEAPEELLPESLKKYEVARTACASCVVPCKDVFQIPEGPYKGEIGKAMEHECIHCLGTNSGITDPVAIMTMENLADKYGMCVIGLGNAIAFVKDLYNRGIIGKKETEGLDLSWENLEAQIELIHQIALRQGFGNLVAEGLYNIAKIIGPESMPFCYHVKGLSRGHFPAGIFSLAHATSTRGADHLRGRSWAFGENDPDLWPDLIENGHIPEEDPVKTLFIAERAVTLTDMIGRCKGAVNNWASAVPLVFKYPLLDGLARLMSAVTGEPYSEKDLEEASDRVYLLEMAFNARQGIRRKDDRFPVKWDMIGTKEAQEEEAKHEKMLEAYYQLRGCDLETGLPTKEAMEKLGLSQEAEKLYGSDTLENWDGPTLWPLDKYPSGNRRA
ncbi:MAG: aldehyde ferredoxin oxidoreductase [Thermovirga sp.]|nr:aldehyde ferredoxin oxidoreductase [Thermovirga sp.]